MKGTNSAVCLYHLSKDLPLVGAKSTINYWANIALLLYSWPPNAVSKHESYFCIDIDEYYSNNLN